MPIFMDVHIIPGVKAREVAQAHQLDLMHQEEHHCKCMTYWIDEQRESVFCLIDAPNKEAVEEMHNQAHGLIPSKIIEVKSNLVESFLGRIYDPVTAAADDGLKVFAEPSFRILMLTKITDPVLLKYKLGVEKTEALLSNLNTIIKQNLHHFGGSEAVHGGDGFTLSFTAASQAISCGLAIVHAVKTLDGSNELNLKIGIHAGEPIAKSNTLFGDTIQMAGNICAVAGNMQVAVTGTVKELALKDHFQKRNTSIFTLSVQDEALLELLFTKLEEHWQNTEFDISNYCQATAMSASQLYRKTISLTGLSPNLLLKDFRLEKARELMKKKHYSISQVTFECGFSSPSYFTKCFKKKYGLLPMAYIDLLQ
jgi:AraC-like DNA-binding protein